MSDGCSVGTNDGINDGCSVGASDGVNDGCSVGTSDGINDGCSDGASDGASDGINEGCRVGTRVGTRVGARVGASDGMSDGCSVGTNDGMSDGVNEGCGDGASDGINDGCRIGTRVGANVGASDGIDDGTSVGSGVGMQVYIVGSVSQQGVPRSLSSVIAQLSTLLLSDSCATSVGTSPQSLLYPSSKAYLRILILASCVGMCPVSKFCFSSKPKVLPPELSPTIAVNLPYSEGIVETSLLPSKSKRFDIWVSCPSSVGSAPSRSLLW